MELFLYVSKNHLFNYLARNLIACEAVIPDIEGNRTVSTRCESFLFLTHLKLNESLRKFGIALPDHVQPVALKVNADVGFLKDRQIILAEKSDKSPKLSLGVWSDYDTQKHAGLFIIGGLPFSCVEKFLFENAKDMQEFYRPSPDYWYPTKRFDVLNPSEFADELALDITQDELLNQTGLSPESIAGMITKLEKQRAALLFFVMASENWRYGKFRLNMDSALAALLGIEEREVAKYIPDYFEIKDKDNREALNLLHGRTHDEKIPEFLNQAVYNRLFELFAGFDPSAGKSGEGNYRRDFVFECFDEIDSMCKKLLSCSSAVSKSLSDMRSLIEGGYEGPVEQILEEVPKDADILKALLFVARDPVNFEQFKLSIKIYRADVVTARRAFVLWGALNGLRGVPGGGGWSKDNEQLWQFVEWNAVDIVRCEDASFISQKPDVSIKSGELFGISLVSKKVFEVDEIHKIVCGNKNAFPDDTKKKVEAFAQKKLRKKDFGSKYYRIISPFKIIIPGKTINEGDDMPQDIVDILTKAIKSSQLNEQKLLQDWIEDFGKFSLLAKNDDDYEYWNDLALQLTGEKNE